MRIFNMGWIKIKMAAIKVKVLVAMKAIRTRIFKMMGRIKIKVGMNIKMDHVVHVFHAVHASQTKNYYSRRKSPPSRRASTPWRHGGKTGREH